jgi:hypothetical protein
MLGGEEPDYPKEGKQSMAHINPHKDHMGIWNAISFPNSFIYQALSNPYKFYSTYLFINPETVVSPTITTKH